DPPQHHDPDDHLPRRLTVARRFPSERAGTMRRTRSSMQTPAPHARRSGSGSDDRPFRNRADAGRLLAEELSAYAGRADVLVLALPRGGVPVAFEVARALKAPLDVFIVRKLGLPGHEELAM